MRMSTKCPACGRTIPILSWKFEFRFPGVICANCHTRSFFGIGARITYFVIFMACLALLLEAEFQFANRHLSNLLEKSEVGFLFLVIAVASSVIPATLIAAASVASWFSPMIKSFQFQDLVKGLREVHASECHADAFTATCPSCNTSIGILGFRLNSAIHLTCRKCGTVIIYEGNTLSLVVRSGLIYVMIMVTLSVAIALLKSLFHLSEGMSFVPSLLSGTIWAIVMYLWVIHRYKVKSVWSK